MCRINLICLFKILFVFAPQFSKSISYFCRIDPLLYLKHNYFIRLFSDAYFFHRLNAVLSSRTLSSYATGAHF
jgi:hypothetical protein